MSGQSSSTTSGLFQAMPVATSQVVDSSGVATHVWYRFFYTIWQRLLQDTSSLDSLGGITQRVTNVEDQVNQALQAISGETQRAEAAEANLQAQIDRINQILVEIITRLA
jgi:hypothetical protein